MFMLPVHNMTQNEFFLGKIQKSWNHRITELFDLEVTLKILFLPLCNEQEQFSVEETKINQVLI